MEPFYSRRSYAVEEWIQFLYVPIIGEVDAGSVRDFMLIMADDTVTMNKITFITGSPFSMRLPFIDNPDTLLRGVLMES